MGRASGALRGRSADREDGQRPKLPAGANRFRGFPISRYSLFGRQAMKAVLAVLAGLLLVALLAGSSFVSRRNQMAVKREAGANRFRGYRQSPVRTAQRADTFGKNRRQWPPRFGAGPPARGGGKLSAVEVQRELPSVAG